MQLSFIKNIHLCINAATKDRWQNISCLFNPSVKKVEVLVPACTIIRYPFQFFSQQRI